MEEYREAQREKWLRAQHEKQNQASGSASSNTPETTTSRARTVCETSGSAPLSGAAGSSASASSTAAGSAAGSSAARSSGASSSAAPSTADLAASTAAAPANGGAAAATGRKPTARRVHILPVSSSPDSSDRRRLDMLAPVLRRKRDDQDVIKAGLFLRTPSNEFIVVKSEPDECVLAADTDYFVEGEPIVRYEKVQFICLRDFESSQDNQDSMVLFNNYISPHFRSIADCGEDMGNIVIVGDIMKICDLEFRVMAAEPSPPDIGIIDNNTMVFVDWDGTPEFDKIHIVPFQDTLPHAYEYDVFTDYLKPYLTKNKHMRFGVNDQFTYQGVQFKVVCCEPIGPARIGRNTTIYCEGVLHPSLRNLLPPELLEQLSHLPPGLQMLLLNTEALAGGYEERLIEVQEMLSRRRGLSNDTINRVDKFRWEENSSQNAQTQCMVCLSNFADGEEVRVLPCGHVFHAPCIDEWLRRCTDCPICKANVDRAVRQY